MPYSQKDLCEAYHVGFGDAINPNNRMRGKPIYRESISIPELISRILSKRKKIKVKTKTEKDHYMKCRIKPGAFSGERIIDFKMADGNTYSGLVPTCHCRTSTFKKVNPELKRSINGYVVVIPNKIKNRLIVEIPNGELVQVPDFQLPGSTTSTGAVVAVVKTTPK